MSLAGPHRKANVGMSNENGDENAPHRKAKVSSAMAVIGGLVGVYGAGECRALRGRWLIFHYYLCRPTHDGMPGVLGPDGIGR